MGKGLEERGSRRGYVAQNGEQGKSQKVRDEEREGLRVDKHRFGRKEANRRKGDLFSRIAGGWFLSEVDGWVGGSLVVLGDNVVGCL